MISKKEYEEIISSPEFKRYHAVCRQISDYYNEGLSEPLNITRRYKTALREYRTLLDLYEKMPVPKNYDLSQGLRRPLSL